MADPEQNPAEPEPIREPKARTIVWLKGVTDQVPVPPHLAPNAPYLGLDTATRDVFIHAPSLDLDMLKVAEALGMDCCVFANPSAVGTADEAFVAINYLEKRLPAVFEDYGLGEVRRRVRATYARDRTR